MDENKIEQLLREDLAVAHENKETLKKIERHLRWGRNFKLAYWVLILGTAFGIFYFVQPYVDSIFETYRSARTLLQ